MTVRAYANAGMNVKSTSDLKSLLSSRKGLKHKGVGKGFGSCKDQRVTVCEKRVTGNLVGSWSAMDVKPVSVEGEERIERDADHTSFVRVPQADGSASPRSHRRRASSMHALIGVLLEPVTGPSCSVPGACERN